MGLRRSSSAVRLCAFAALALALSFTSSNSTGLAQSGPPPLTPWRGLMDFVDGNLYGYPSGEAGVTRRSISGDGRYAVFSSWAYDLVAGEYTSGQQIFVRDRMTGVTTRATARIDDDTLPSYADMPVISANGRHVAFASGDSAFVPGDTNDHWDVFVRDLDAARTVRVSVASDGTQASADSYFPAISATGRFVVFTSNASLAGPESTIAQTYVHDRDADGNGTFDEAGGVSTTRVSVATDGTPADSYSDNPSISGDGRFVTFESPATNLDAAGNAGNSNHLYMHDRQTGQTWMVDRSVTGGPSEYGVDYRTSDLSVDGRYVSYASYSSDIVVPGNGQEQIFRYDRTTSQTTMVSVLPDGTPGNGWSYFTSISGDGRYVVFLTTANNLASPAPPAGKSAVVVRDFNDGSFTRIDLLPNGTALDHEYPYTPAISADGSAVAFQSNANNALPNGYSAGRQHLFVATAFSVSPTSASFPMAGAPGAIEVNTSAVTGWGATTTDSWITVTDGGSFAGGPRTVSYVVEANPAGIVRNGKIRVGSTDVTIHQEGDGDTTPPVITPVVTGTQINGWYTSNVTLHWEISDPETAFTVDEGCYDLTFTNDFMDAAPHCRATSHGGSAYEIVHLRRDTTAPAITVNVPATTAYALNATVVPSYSCSDGGAGVETCAVTAPFDSTTPGRKVFTVTATDRAGHTATKSVEYIIGTGVCVDPNASLKGWFRFEGDGADALGNLYAVPTPNVPVYYDPAIAGRGWHGQGDHYLDTHDWQRFLAWQGLTISAWVGGGFTTGESATIVAKPSQYKVAVFPDRTLRWAFSHTTGFDWVNTGYKLPPRVDIFVHVAITYDAGLVTTYVNGQAVHSQQLTGTLVNDVDYSQSLTIGGRAGANAPFWGTLDDVQIYTGALTATQVEAIALAGNGSLCVPQSTSMTLTVPPTVGYLGSVPATVVLRDGNDQPLAGKHVAVYSWLSTPGQQPGVASGETDANGRLELLVPVQTNALVGDYPNGMNARFLGDVHYLPVQADAAITVVRGSPSITWNAPSAITYGTALGASQLNASANVPGTFSYSPAAGAVLQAGAQTLSVTFTPDDLDRLQPITATTGLVVNKATPQFAFDVGSYTYDKQPHAATVTATGVNGEVLSPVQVYYNSSLTPPTNAGSYYVRGSFAGSANYNSAFVTGPTPLIIRKYVPTAHLFGGPYTYDGQQHYPSVSVRGAGGDYLTPFGYFFDGWTYTIPVNAGTHTVQVQYNGDSNYEAIRVEDLSFVINKATPAISLGPSTRTYNGSPQVVTASAYGVNYASLGPVVVTYDGSTTAPSNAGSYALVARYDGSTNYNAVSVNGTLTIGKGTPAVSWAAPASIVYGTPLGAAQLNATSPVAGQFEYSPAAGAVLPAGARTLNVTFVPNDAANYNTAASSVPLAVTKATPAVTWGAPADIVYGTALGAAQLNATANTAGSFAYSPAAGTVLNAGAHTLSATFTPSDTANYNSASGSASLTVLKATPRITWTAPAPIVYGTALGAAQLHATADIAGTFVYSPAAGTVLDPGTAQALSVSFTPDDAANYTSATAVSAIDVARATPTLSWPSPGAITYGRALDSSQLNGSADVAGTFEYSPAAGTVLGAGTHTLSVTFTPADAVRYNSVSGTVMLTVNPGTPAIAWDAPASLVYGSALGEGQLNADASVAGTFAYTPAAGTVLDPGTHVLSVTFTPADAVNYTPATATTTITVGKATPSVTWAAPGAIVYGTALGAAQLNATASVAGTFAYSPAAGTVPGAGTQTLSVTFTPADTDRYTTATATTTITVGKGTPSVTWATPGAIVYGTPLGAGQLNASANVAGTFSYSPEAGTVLAVGNHPLSVTFTPADADNYTGASAGTTLTVVRAPLTIAAVDASKPFGAPLPAFSAAAAGFVNGDSMAALTGTLTFTTSATASSAVGTYAVTPQGLSAANYTITFASGTLTVVRASTAATVASNPGPSGINQPVTFVAAVTVVAPGAGAPTGSVQFFDGGVLLGSAALAGGSASLTTNGLAAGNHNVTATYSGDAGFAASSGAGVHTVNPPSTSSATTLVSSANPSTTGQNVSFTATATSPAGGVGGSVEFFDGAMSLGTITLVNGSARLTTPLLASGGHAITARYLGNGTLPPSVSAALAQTVQPSGAKTRTTTTALVASPSPVALGNAVTLTATITGSQRQAPTGTVLYMVNGQVIGQATASVTGSVTADAVLGTSGLARGTHSVTVVYLGDATYRASTATVTLSVN